MFHFNHTANYQHVISLMIDNHLTLAVHSGLSGPIAVQDCSGLRYLLPITELWVGLCIELKLRDILNLPSWMDGWM